MDVSFVTADDAPAIALEIECSVTPFNCEEFGSPESEVPDFG